MAALLLTALSASIAAADSTEHTSKNAQKILATLNLIGVNDKEIQNFIEESNAKFENGYLNLAQEEALGGKVTLRYGASEENSIDGRRMPRKLELYYAPEDSHLSITARTSGIQACYKFKFP